MDVKKELYILCETYVNQRKETVEKVMKSNRIALEGETKSSAGDKHETGRAMLQLEMEKASQQFEVVQKMTMVLQQINIIKTSEIICLGSIVYTTKGIYFLAISVGKLIVEKTEYYVISSSSPIGKLLLGKQKNDSIVFNGNKIEIKEVT